MADQPARSRPSSPLNDLVVLAVLGEEPAHGFALSRLLAPDSDLGRIVTLRRAQVYRSIDRLLAAALVRPLAVEPGDAGPQRTVLAPSDEGRAVLDRWLEEPVAHVRHLRVEFLIKLRLLERLGRDPSDLVRAQRRALAPTLDQLLAPGSDDDDVVDRWRAHNAAAADRFLSDLVGGDEAIDRKDPIDRRGATDRMGRPDTSG